MPLDLLFWQRVLAKLPAGFSVMHVGVDADSPNTWALTLVVDEQVTVGVHTWRLEQIARRHTHLQPAADALARAVRGWLRHGRRPSYGFSAGPGFHLVEPSGGPL